MEFSDFHSRLENIIGILDREVNTRFSEGGDELFDVTYLNDEGIYGLQLRVGRADASHGFHKDCEVITCCYTVDDLAKEDRENDVMHGRVWVEFLFVRKTGEASFEFGGIAYNNLTLGRRAYAVNHIEETRFGNSAGSKPSLAPDNDAEYIFFSHLGNRNVDLLFDMVCDATGISTGERSAAFSRFAQRLEMRNAYRVLLAEGAIPDSPKTLPEKAVGYALIGDRDSAQGIVLGLMGDHRLQEAYEAAVRCYRILPGNAFLPAYNLAAELMIDHYGTGALDHYFRMGDVESFRMAPGSAFLEELGPEDYLAQVPQFALPIIRQRFKQEYTGIIAGLHQISDARTGDTPLKAGDYVYHVHSPGMTVTACPVYGEKCEFIDFYTGDPGLYEGMGYKVEQVKQQPEERHPWLGGRFGQFLADHLGMRKVVPERQLIKVAGIEGYWDPRAFTHYMSR